MDDDGGELELGLSLGGGGCGNVETTSLPSRRRSIFTANDMPRVFSTIEPKTPSSTTNATSQAVGWPPVGSYRLNNLITQTKSAQEEQEQEENKIKTFKPLDVNNISNYKTDQSARKETTKGHIGFVKVNMDGLPIGRKVDLKAHLCYETLAQAIENMFFKSSTKATSSSCATTVEATNISKLLDGSSEFVLTYEDKEGDWMLVGDVPWRMFLNTVKRLRIMRTSEANGLAPRFQARN